ncbi:MAG: anthranilate phosphoribosyltransferase [Eubacteriales bacterium]
MIKEAILSLQEKENLTSAVAQSAMNEMMTGEATEEDIATYLTALAEKGETVEEIVASAQVMRQHCYKLPPQPHCMEIVGTGGDKSNSFNISTTSAIVLAASGVPMAKHGNRAASSQCGSADVLEALGVNIDINPEKSLELLEKNNICFLFAQKFHPAMKYVAPVRRKLGIRTIFNLLGPLTNPLGAKKQLLGVYDETWVQPMAEVLENLAVESGVVVHGTDGLDEISLSAATTICEFRNGVSQHKTITPQDFGFSLCEKSALLGGTPKENAEITRRIFFGEKFPCRDAVILNAGAGLYVARDNLTMKEAMDTVATVIDSGLASDTLEKFIQLSNQ